MDAERNHNHDILLQIADRKVPNSGPYEEIRLQSEIKS